MTRRRGLLLAALLVAVTPAACGGDDDDDGAPAVRSGPGLAGTTWVLTSYQRVTGTTASAVDGAAASLAFRVAGTLSGTTGCNDFRGTYETSGSDLTIDLGPVTLAACADTEEAAQEAAILEALPEVATFDLAGDELVLADEDGEPRLAYRPGVTGLAGTAWRVIGVHDGDGAVVTSALTEALTAEFDADDAFTGFGGCNSLSGPYSISGADELSVGPLASTRMACGAEVDELERQYIAALEASTTYELVGDRLTLRDGDGAAQVTATAATG